VFEWQGQVLAIFPNTQKSDFSVRFNNRILICDSQIQHLIRFKYALVNCQPQPSTSSKMSWPHVKRLQYRRGLNDLCFIYLLTKTKALT
jgi:hypothetical protein